MYVYIMNLLHRCEEHANKEQELKQTVCFLILTPSLI